MHAWNRITELAEVQLSKVEVNFPYISALIIMADFFLSIGKLYICQFSLDFDQTKS